MVQVLGGLSIENLGGMAEWSKAAALKAVDRKVRGFESYSLRHTRLKVGSDPGPGVAQVRQELTNTIGVRDVIKPCVIR